MAYQRRHIEWIDTEPGFGISVPEDLLCADYALLAGDHEWLEEPIIDGASHAVAEQVLPFTIGGGMLVRSRQVMRDIVARVSLCSWHYLYFGTGLLFTCARFCSVILFCFLVHRSGSRD